MLLFFLPRIVTFCFGQRIGVGDQFTSLSVGDCTGGWSSWKDRDDPTGKGDWEMLNDFTDDDLCPNPVAAEARIIGLTILSTDETVSFSLAGLSCVNANQQCSDYEIRFCCEKTTSLVVGDCTGKWSSWKDRDNPSGAGDWEMLNSFDDDDLCANPVAAEARIIGTTSLVTTEVVSFSLAGLICHNSYQLSGVSCSDYEIRFCCPEVTTLATGDCTGRWSSWKDRDNPSGNGDYELLRSFDEDDLCEKPMAAEARIIGSTILSTTEIVSFSVAGLVCLNNNQPLRRCSDYEVRFCCGGDRGIGIST